MAEIERPNGETDRERRDRYEALEASYPTLTGEEYVRQTRRSFLTGGGITKTGWSLLTAVAARPPSAIGRR